MNDAAALEVVAADGEVVAVVLAVVDSVVGAAWATGSVSDEPDAAVTATASPTAVSAPPTPSQGNQRDGGVV
ncbi:hypothetical protein CRM90_06910 [Mycobacterium sp. ENV421]|uniref:hypothetical protein n=1 Tax=Mycobacteriaceae TaxID=1762 RepID=UPI000C9A60C8|nr:hypothetical protein [Mycobacterium sp. ENV421]PND58365.1 hypothetical protein CRM90_06910 [Mycobacterium sp. ENV421]